MKKKQLKKIMLSIVILMTPFLMDAQLNIDWTEFRKSKSTISQNLYLDGHIYMIKVDKNGFSFSKKNYTYFLKYDLNLNELKKVKRRLNYDSKRSTFSKLLTIDNRLFLFSNFSSLKKGKKIILTEIDKDELQPIGEEIELLVIKKRSIFSKAKFSVEQSPDKNYTLIVADLAVNINAPRAFQFILLDKELKIISKEKITIKNTGSAFKFIQAKVDNNGNVFRVGVQHYVPSFNNRSKLIVWSYQRKTNTEQVNVFPSMKSKNITQVDFDLSNEMIVIGGYYSERKGDESVRGVFSGEADKFELEELDLKFESFSEDILKHRFDEFELKKIFRKNKSIEYEDLFIKQVLKQANGQIIIIGETEYTVNNNNGNYIRVIEDLIVTGLDKKGNMIWCKPIIKKASKEDWFQHDSYMLDVDGNDLLFFYNYKNGSEITKGMHLSKINQEGELTTMDVYKKDRTKFFPCPRYCIKLEDKKYLIYGRKWLDEKFGILTLQ